MLEINTATEKNVLIIELNGSLSSGTASDFKIWCEEKIYDGYLHLAVDCGDLEFISSGGIGALIDVQNFIRKKNGNLVLFNTSDEVNKLLDFLKITDHLKIYSTYEDMKAEFEVPAETNPPVAAPSAEEVHLPTENELEKNVVNHEPNIIVEQEESQAYTSQAEEFSTSHISSETTTEYIDKISRDLHVAEDEDEIILTLDDVSEEYEQKQPHKEDAQLSQSIQLQPDQQEAIHITRKQYIATEKKEPDSNIVFCPNCGVKLRVSKKGKYLCPSCRVQFHYPFY